MLVLALVLWPGSAALAADEPDLIFRRSTVFKWLSPNDKLATYGVDDPEVEGVACHFTVPERGGFKGWLGLAEEVSDISLACRQIGPIHFKDKMEQGDDMFRQRRSLFFKKMQIVRGCDAKRNVLVYMVYSDKLIEGSPKNSTSSVPIMPWGAADTAVQKCGEFIQCNGLGLNLSLKLGFGEAGAGGPTARAGHWGRGSPPNAPIFAAPIRFRGRSRRFAASWRRKPSGVRLQWICFVDPQLGKAVRSRPNFRPSAGGFTGRVFRANIDTAVAHDCCPC